jgi:hypothetical protein
MDDGQPQGIFAQQNTKPSADARVYCGTIDIETM